MIKIVQKDDLVLRQDTKDVPLDKIKSREVKAVIKDMKTALKQELDAVAIAAPQIGVPLRIFVVSGRVFAKKTNRDIPIKNLEAKEVENLSHKDQVYINPKILKLSKETKKMEEGCLSARYLYGWVRRATKATVEAYDENGKKFKRGASGLLAQIFQHETDHLIGTLFLDKAEDVVDIPPEEMEKYLKNDQQI